MDIKKPLIFLLLLLFSLGLIAQTIIIQKSDIIETRNGKSYYVHNTLKGQTVYSISKAYDVTPDEIYFENPGTRQGINVNQTIYIPTVNKETELKKGVTNTNFDFFYHVAANNETFEQISEVYLIPVKYIRKANPNLAPPFREGEYVKVPVEEAFDILDGNISSPVIAENNIEIYKPPVKKRVNPYSNPKPTNNNSTTNKKRVNNASGSETVSFDPNIPIIQDYRHVVILGETTASIAKKYNIPIDLLKAANPGLGNTVQKGDRLRIPDKSKIPQVNDSSKTIKPVIADFNTNNEPVTTSDDKPQTTDQIKVKEKDKPIIHIVEKKETLYSIGREYGLTVDELLLANPGLTTLIKVGQKIIVPKKKISKPYIIHLVDSKSRTNKIAKLYRISTFQIRDFNPNIGSRVYKGQEIMIPVGSKAIIVPFLPEDETPTPDEIKDDEADNKYFMGCDFKKHNNRVFKVALMIPLSLEETDSLDIDKFFMKPQPYFKSFRFLKFYEGALMALDSITKQGANVEFYVYDVDKNITKTVKILKEPELKKMDLIIGPFFNNSFNQVALFAGNFNIPIVNPLSYRDAIVNNYKTVFKVKPTIMSQKPVLETYINKFSGDSKVFLISQTSYVDADIVTEFKNGILSIIDNQVKVSNQELLELAYDVAERDSLYDNNILPANFLFENTEIYPEILENTINDSTIINNQLIKINYSVDSLYPFLQHASPIRNNVVILYGTRKSFVLDVLNRLNESRDTFDIKLIGLPTWERISNLNNIKMDNLNLSYFSSGYVDYESDNIQEFIYNFRNNFNSEPDNYAFSGFDITYFFLNALYYLDKDINTCIEQFPMELTQGRYSFQRVGNTNNYVNNYWHLLQIKQLEKVKVNDQLLIPENQDYYYE